LEQTAKEHRQMALIWHKFAWKMAVQMAYFCVCLLVSVQNGCLEPSTPVGSVQEALFLNPVKILFPLVEFLPRDAL